MGDQHNVASQKSDDLHSFAENTQQEGGLPMSIDNDDIAGEATEDVDGAAAAATIEHKEESFVDPFLLPASAVPVNDHQSSDGEISSQSIDTQLHATDDEANEEMNSHAGQQEHWKHSGIFSVQFLANMNSSSCSLFVIDGPSVVCRLSVVCNVGTPYSGD